MPISCQTFTDWLSKAEELPLDAAQLSDMQAHRDECPLCARFEQQQAALLHALRSLPDKVQWTLEDAQKIQQKLSDSQ